MLLHSCVHLIQILMRLTNLWFQIDVVRRLVCKGKQLIALKFIFEFELTDEFPPVPLLKAYVMDSKQFSQKVPESVKSSRQSSVILSKFSPFSLFCHLWGSCPYPWCFSKLIR